MAKSKKAKGPQQKQRANVYTMMLIVPFLALGFGSLILYKELDKYEYWAYDYTMWFIVSFMVLSIFIFIFILFDK